MKAVDQQGDKILFGGTKRHSSAIYVVAVVAAVQTISVYGRQPAVRMNHATPYPGTAVARSYVC